MSVDTFQDAILSFGRVSTDFLCHILNDESDVEISFDSIAVDSGIFYVCR